MCPLIHQYLFRWSKKSRLSGLEDVARGFECLEAKLAGVTARLRGKKLEMQAWSILGKSRSDYGPHSVLLCSGAHTDLRIVASHRGGTTRHRQILVCIKK
jgi:hypothetical protein